MIKINLLKGKNHEETLGTPDFLKMEFKFTSLQDLWSSLRYQMGNAVSSGSPARRILVPLLMVGLLYYGSSYQKELYLTEAQERLMILSDQLMMLDKKEKELKKLEPIKQMLEKDEEDLKRKIQTLKEVNQKKYLGTKILASLSTSVPASIWFDNISVTPLQVLISGYSFDFGDISDFMKRLKENSLFADVTLVNTTKADQKGGKQDTNLARFEISLPRRGL